MKIRACQRDYSDVSINESPSMIWKITRESVNLRQEVVRARCNKSYQCNTWLYGAITHRDVRNMAIRYVA
jgi:hypothetical protein